MQAWITGMFASWHTVNYKTIDDAQCHVHAACTHSGLLMVSHVCIQYYNVRVLPWHNTHDLIYYRFSYTLACIELDN